MKHQFNRSEVSPLSDEMIVIMLLSKLSLVIGLTRLTLLIWID